MPNREDKLALKRIVLRHWLRYCDRKDSFKEDFYNSLLTYTWLFQKDIPYVYILFTILKFIDTFSNIFEITENLNDIIQKATNGALEFNCKTESVLFLNLNNPILVNVMIDNGLFENRMLKKMPILCDLSKYTLLRKGAFLTENNQYGGITKHRIDYLHSYMITI